MTFEHFAESYEPLAECCAYLQGEKCPHDIPRVQLCNERSAEVAVDKRSDQKVQKLSS